MRTIIEESPHTSQQLPRLRIVLKIQEIYFDFQVNVENSSVLFWFQSRVISRVFKIKRNCNDFLAMFSSIFVDSPAECFMGVKRKDENWASFLR